MKVIITANYTSMSAMALEELEKAIAIRPHPLICVASGDTPAGLYSTLSEKVKTNHLDVSSWSFVGLDEWMGMNGGDEGSCRYYVDKQLFEPLRVKNERICFFNGRSGEPEEEVAKAERFISENGGIDVAILGIGLNGHIGMNEPGTSANSRSRITELDPLTQKTGQKYFTGRRELSKGITLGIGTLMEARKIILLASGSHKADIAKTLIEGEISEKVPASLLRKHPGTIFIMDREAAILLQNHE